MEATMQKTVELDGVRLETEAFGNPQDPPILLIMGMMASMLWWPEEFCRQLASRGYFVIRYDNRDTGLSTTYTPGEPGYTFEDMVDDGVRVIEAYGYDKAHIVGMSMGGMIAQLVALKHPRHVLSLTVLSTSPVGIDTSDLPGMTDAYREHSAQGETVDWSDRASVIGFIRADVHALASTRHPHDAGAAKAAIERDYDRATRFQSATNHFILVGDDAPSRKASDIRVPTLVVHGETDPLFPVEHGEALAGAIPGARLVRIAGGGHELHPLDWPWIIDAIADHVGAS